MMNFACRVHYVLGLIATSAMLDGLQPALAQMGRMSAVMKTRSCRAEAKMLEAYAGLKSRSMRNRSFSQANL